MSSKIIEIDYVDELTVSDARFAQACCEFKCISCNHSIIYSSYKTGREEWECEKCLRSYTIESIVFNETYDQNFNTEQDAEEIKITRVFTEISNAASFISDLK